MPTGRKLRYKCVVLDHDDTAVMSSKELHYPSFCEIMEKMRPDAPKYSFEEFMRFCFEPGFSVYMQEKHGFTDEDFDEEYRIWKDFIKGKTPDFYPGFLELVKDLQELGAFICVVSHSEKAEIVRHYAENGVQLDLVYGWELPPEKRKPYAYPMEQIMKKLGVEAKDCVMVDDLKLGGDMAKLCGVDFVTAGWSHEFDDITDYMKENFDIYFKTVEELRNYLIIEE